MIQVEGHGELRWVGYLALVLSVLFAMIGVFRYYSLRRQLHGFYQRQSEGVPSAPP